jgi:hypothetical protein
VQVISLFAKLDLIISYHHARAYGARFAKKYLETFVDFEARHLHIQKHVIVKKEINKKNSNLCAFKSRRHQKST